MCEPESQEQVTASGEPVLPKKRRTSLRWTTWLLPIIGISAPLIWFAWPFLGSPAAIRISPETTWITEPVGADGYVDYVEHLRQKLVEAETADAISQSWKDQAFMEQRPTPRHAFPAYTSPEVAARGELEAALREVEGNIMTYEELLDRMRRVPWTTEDFPKVAQTIASNERWFSFAKETYVPISPIVLPIGTGNPLSKSLYHARFVGLVARRQNAQRLRLRAAFRFGSGDVEKALEDVHFLHQIASAKPVFIMSFIGACRIESRASQTTIIGLLSSTKISQEAIAQIEQLPIDSLTQDLLLALEGKRLSCLDEINLIHKTGRFDQSSFVDFSGTSKLTAWLLRRRLHGNLDWNEILEAINRFFDDFSAAITEHDFKTRLRRIQSIRGNVDDESAKQRVLSRSLTGDTPSTRDFIVAQKNSIGFGRCHIQMTTSQLQRRVVQISARLAVWKIRNGEYPDSLQSLTSIQGFMNTSPDIFVDPFTGNQILYERTEQGFRLRSHGANGLPGETKDMLTGLRSGIWDELSGDYLWQWPLVERY